MATNNSVDVGLSGSTGTGNFVGATSPTLVTPNVGAATFTSLEPNSNNQGFLDSSGASALAIANSGGTGANYYTLQTATTGNPPIFAATGSDTNVVAQFEGKGNGGVAIQGTTAGGNATAGYVGELISSVIASGSGVSFSSTVTKDLTSISLTAGDWDVYGNITFTGTTVTEITIWTSSTSATQPDLSLVSTIGGAAFTAQGCSVPTLRYSLSATTTIYISGNVSGTGTLKGQGGIYARRRR